MKSLYSLTPPNALQCMQQGLIKVLELRNAVPSRARALRAEQGLCKQICIAIESQREPDRAEQLQLCIWEADFIRGAGLTSLSCLQRECELLDAPSGRSLRLLSLHQAALLVVKLGLKVLDLLLKPRGDLPASLHGLLLGLVQLRLHVLHLALEGAPVLLAVLSILIPHNCHFWYATTFFRPVKGTSKKCVNSRQNCLATKQRKTIFCNANSHLLVQLF